MMLKKLLAVAGMLLVWNISNAQSCYETSIVTPTPFMGNNGEVFKLSDGSIWEVKYAYEYLYEYYPTVIICPSRGKLAVKGKTIDVEQLNNRGSSDRGKKSTTIPVEDVIESKIDGTFNGWTGDTIFKLANGQIWQQNRYAYTYSYKFRPDVIIFKTRNGFEMQVEGMDTRVGVERIK